MKKRRSLVISLLLVAALTLGIGYASLTDDLAITGSAAIDSNDAKDAFAEDVYFTKAVVTEGRATAEIVADDNNEANDKVVITVPKGVLKGEGDSVICTLEISNVGDLDALVTLDSNFVSNSTYFQVTTSWEQLGNKSTLAAKGDVDLVVTIKCIKTPTTDVSTTFDIGMTATAVDSATTLPVD